MEKLIVMAMHSEADELIKRLRAVQNAAGDYITADGKTGVVITEVGKVNAAVQTTRAILAYRPKLVINAGISGGLDEDIEVLSAVICDRVRYHDFYPAQILEKYSPHAIDMSCDPAAADRLESLCRKNGYSCRRGRAVCGDKIVDDAAEAARLRVELGGSCVDMESAAVAHTCVILNTPFAVIRVISDFADENALDSMQTQEYRSAVMFSRLIADM